VVKGNSLKEGGELQRLRDQCDAWERRDAERTRELGEKTQLLDSLHQISLSVLSMATDREKLLDSFAEKVLVLGVFRSLMIALVDWEADEVRVVRSFSRWNEERGLLDEIELVPHRLDIKYSLDDENITAVAARSGQLQVVEEWDDRLDSRVDTPRHRQGQVAYFIPIMYGERSVAVFATGSLVADKEATLQRIEQMQPLLDQVAMALVQTRLFAEVNKNNGELRQEVARRERVEEELRASEGKWRLLLENIPDFVAVIDAEGRVLSANRPLNPSGGQEQVCNFVCSCEGLGNGPLIKGWIDLVFWTGDSVEFEIPAADMQGIAREFLIAPIDHGDKSGHAIFIARDISER
jgi:PAS domain-containing protein